MKIIKDMSCECGGYISPLACEIEDKYKKKSIVVSHGICINCGNNMALPTEKYNEFVTEYCIEL